jgi:hypothetical protein
MSYPERSIDPDEPADEADTRGEKPDWLVHAEQASDGEVQGLERPHARLSLHRPDTASDAGANAAREPEKPKAVAWQAAASSVPRLKEAPTAHKMEGRGPKTSWSASEREDEDIDDDGYDALAPASAADEADPEVAALARAQASLRPLDEPFWAVWIDAVRGLPIGVQAAIGIVLMVGAAFFVWPKADPGMSIGAIRTHARDYDGRAVKIRGVASDVFPMADGFVYNLHQGKEYVVVYAKGTPPRPKDWVTVTGTANVGYLDGAPRISVFETSPTR